MEDLKKQHLFEKEEKLYLFGDGPWIEEPDLLEFTHSGIDCIIVRILNNVFGGHLCGYVRIPKGNPLFGTDQQKDQELDCDVEITFNQFDGNVHWIGFDCAHSFDLVPSMNKTNVNSIYDYLPDELPKPTYKNLDYVISETKILAEAVKNFK